MDNKNFEIFLMTNWDIIKRIQHKRKGTFGEAKQRIYRYFKRNYGITFMPSFLILSCDTYTEYRKLINGEGETIINI